jgi:hypothetical protein
MGREVKRVALDFNWPLNAVWPGFINPIVPPKCSPCDGEGYSPEAKKIADSWYNANQGYKGGWQHNITQDEVQALVDRSRLFDFTHTWNPEHGWVPREPMVIPTAAEVNEWSKRGFGHDSINRMICVEQRCKRLGIETECSYCKGKGHIFFDDDLAQRYNEWKEHQPPSGEGWQLWETVSEGSPISPVFPSEEALVSYLIDQGHTHKAAKAFVQAAWAPSMRMENGQIRSNVDVYERD